MITIRKNVFETNSSATHSLCICTEEEYRQFTFGRKVLNTLSDKLVNASSVKDDPRSWYKSYDQLGTEGMGFFEEYFETPSGDKMVAFGEFGYC